MSIDKINNTKLSEEEKKAIAYLNDCIIRENIFEEDFALYNIEILIKLINKLLNENKNEIKARDILAQLNETLKEENKEKDIYIKHSEEITTEMNNDINKLLSEIKEKDKQIDLSAEFIKNNMSEKKIINEICIKGKCNNEECHEDDLKECIKLHFVKLAKEKGE